MGHSMTTTMRNNKASGGAYFVNLKAPFLRVNEQVSEPEYSFHDRTAIVTRDGLNFFS